MRKTLHTTNPYAGQAATSNDGINANADAAMSIEEIKATLQERESNMQKQVPRNK